MISEQSVLIVDDDESVRHAMQRVFRSAGFAVGAFASAQSFLEGYRHRTEACLILDLRMPEMGGLELLARMRELRLDIPVIIYTGNADVPVTVRAMQAGAFAVIEKPFSDELLIDRVRAAITADRTRRARKDRIAEAKSKLSLLTERERQIAECLVEGLSARAVGARLAISARTVEAHRTNLFRKLHISSSAILAQMFLLAELSED